MERLCERPGCSDPASVAYGMRPEDLVFWLDTLRDRAATKHGVLCPRCADSMVVPRGWTLDDLREPDLHLFRPPSDDSGSIPRRRTRRSKGPNNHEQLELGVEAAARPDPIPDPVPTTAPAASVDDLDRRDHRRHDGEGTVQYGEGGEEATPWMPVFDTDDDLDGLLAARSPLLSRAFRGERRA